MSTPAFSIRPASASDIDAIAEIYADAVRTGTASYELEPPAREEMAARFAALKDGEYPYIVAVDEKGAIGGYAYAGPFRTRPAYRFVVEDSIYVAPDRQGQGLGRLLLGALVGECEKLGFRQILAVIGDGSPQSASVRLHAALGFSMGGTLKGTGYKHGRWLDTVLMQLAINGGNMLSPDPASLPERRFQAQRR